MTIVQSRSATTAPRPPRRRRRPTPLRRVKVATIWLHRWTSLVLGLFLVAVTTSGAVLLYTPELSHWAQDSAYADPTPGLREGLPRITLPEASALVDEVDPDFRWDTLHYTPQHDSITAESYASGRRIALDQQTGEVVADFDTQDQGGAVHWFLELNENVHLCFFSCEDYPAYVGFLADEVPHTGWLGFDGANVTWGGLVLGLAALLLVLTSLSGIWLWWPSLRRFSHGLRVRWRKGRYARDYDLHQVVGMACLPFLLMWGVTGANFEFGWVSKAWYAATPGEPLADPGFVSTPPAGVESPRDISIQEVYDAADRAIGERGPITGIEDAGAVSDAPEGTYLVYIADGVDPWRVSDYPGDTGVSVDRYTGDTSVAPGTFDRPISQMLWEDWSYPVHAGTPVNGWWRIVWFVAGMTPLLLMWTGVSTWWWKRTVRRRRRRAAVQRLARIHAVDTADTADTEDPVSAGSEPAPA